MRTRPKPKLALVSVLIAPDPLARPVPRPVPPTAVPVLPGERGYGAVYRPGEEHRCPGCHQRQWIVGRLMAECAFCATALPIVSDGAAG